MKTIYKQCGIYEAQYTLIKHQNGRVSVKHPYMHWTNNSGMLRYSTTLIPKQHQSTVLGFFKNQEFSNDGGQTISDYL